MAVWAAIFQNKQIGRRNESGDQGWVDKEGLEVAEDAENEPCIRISWAGEDHPEAD